MLEILNCHIQESLSAKSMLSTSDGTSFRLHLDFKYIEARNLRLKCVAPHMGPAQSPNQQGIKEVFDVTWTRTMGSMSADVSMRGLELADPQLLAGSVEEAVRKDDNAELNALRGEDRKSVV